LRYPTTSKINADKEKGNFMRWSKVIFGIIIFTLVAISLVGCSSQTNTPSSTVSIKEEQAKKEEEKKRLETEKRQKLEQALQKVTITRDEVENLVWYEGLKPENINYNGLIPYLVEKEVWEKEKAVYMRFHAIYQGNNWVFMDKIIFKTDNNTYEIPVKLSERKSKIISGGVLEWHDVPVDKELFDILTDISTSNKTIMRYRGDTERKDIVITEKEKDNIKVMIDIYNGLNGMLITRN